jgi:hypothetical protein
MGRDHCRLHTHPHWPRPPRSPHTRITRSRPLLPTADSVVAAARLRSTASTGNMRRPSFPPWPASPIRPVPSVGARKAAAFLLRFRCAGGGGNAFVFVIGRRAVSVGTRPTFRGVVASFLLPAGFRSAFAIASRLLLSTH